MGVRRTNVIGRAKRGMQPWRDQYVHVSSWDTWALPVCTPSGLAKEVNVLPSPPRAPTRLAWPHLDTGSEDPYWEKEKEREHAHVQTTLHFTQIRNTDCTPRWRPIESESPCSDARVLPHAFTYQGLHLPEQCLKDQKGFTKRGSKDRGPFSLSRERRPARVYGAFTFLIRRDFG